MNYSNYNASARRTECPYGPVVNRLSAEPVARLIHCGLGLSDELGELAKCNDRVNLLEELGDILWFSSGICDVVGFNPALRTVMFNGSAGITAAVGQINSCVKRHIIYGKELEMEPLTQALQMVFDFVGWVADSARSSMTQVMMMNISKLEARFPERFTEEKAVNRNLEAEAAALER